MLPTLLKPVDKLIDSITMYRLLMYYLSGLLAVAVIFSFAGIMHYNPLAIVGSALTAVVACWLINKLLAAIFTHPYRVGEEVILFSGALGGKYEGKIADISTTHTKLRQKDGQIVLMPNAAILSGTAIIPLRHKKPKH